MINPEDAIDLIWIDETSEIPEIKHQILDRQILDQHKIHETDANQLESLKNLRNALQEERLANPSFMTNRTTYKTLVFRHRCDRCNIDLDKRGQWLRVEFIESRKIYCLCYDCWTIIDLSYPKQATSSKIDDFVSSNKRYHESLITASHDYNEHDFWVDLVGFSASDPKFSSSNDFWRVFTMRMLKMALEHCRQSLWIIDDSRTGLIPISDHMVSFLGHRVILAIKDSQIDYADKDREVYALMYRYSEETPYYVVNPKPEDAFLIKLGNSGRLGVVSLEKLGLVHSGNILRYIIDKYLVSHSEPFDTNMPFIACRFAMSLVCNRDAPDCDTNDLDSS